MLNRREQRTCHTPDLHGRRVLALQDRPLSLQFDELSEQAVVLGILKARVITHVVGVARLLDLLNQI